MKRLCAGLVLAGLVLGAGDQARAQDPVPNVQELLTRCKAPAASELAFYCIGFIDGAGETMAVNGYILKFMRKPEADQLKKVAICPPSDATTSAWMQAFMNWAEKHPELWNQTRVAGVVTALREAWPCASSN